MSNLFAPDIVAKVDFADLQQAQAGLERNAKQVERGNKDGVKAVTIMVWRAIRTRVPVVTGRLKASFLYRFTYLSRKAEGQAYSNLYYAKYVNNGTRWFAGRRYVDRAVEAVGSRVPDTFAGKMRIT